MKFLKLTPLLLLAILMGSCSHQTPIDDTFCWPSSGNAVADTLLLTYERAKAYLPGYREISLDSLAQEMQNVATRNPDNKAIAIRAGYMKAEQMPEIPDPEAKRKYLADLTSQCDSAAMPYDFHVLQRLRAETDPDVYQQFILLTDNLRYFAACHSGIEVARNSSQIGRLLWLMRDHGRAEGYFDESIRFFRQKGLLSDLAYSCLRKSNVVDFNKQTGLMKELLQWIDQDSNAIAPAIRADILHNGAITFDSLELMGRSIQVRLQTASSMSILPLSMMLYGNMLNVRGRSNEGWQYAMSARRALDTCNIEPRYYAAIHHMLGTMYQTQGMKDSAIQELSHAYWANVDYNKRYVNPGIYTRDAKSRIEMAEKNARLEKTRLAMWWVISSLILATVILYLYLQAGRRQQQRRHERQLMEERIENDRQSLRAQAKIVEENERMITSFGNTIDNLKERGLIKEEGADEVRKIMQIYRSNEQYRQGFLKIGQELDAEFKARLKADFPGLSEYRLQLSALIAAGVDSRQITSILNTSYASVYKSRYRLRQCLGLSKDDSLEEFLRKYNRRDDYSMQDG